MVDERKGDREQQMMRCGGTQRRRPAPSDGGGPGQRVAAPSFGRLLSPTEADRAPNTTPATLYDSASSDYVSSGATALCALIRRARQRPCVPLTQAHASLIPLLSLLPHITPSRPCHLHPNHSLLGSQYPSQLRIIVPVQCRRGLQARHVCCGGREECAEEQRGAGRAAEVGGEVGERVRGRRERCEARETGCHAADERGVRDRKEQAAHGAESRASGGRQAMSDFRARSLSFPLSRPPACGCIAPHAVARLPSQLGSILAQSAGRAQV